MEKEPRQTLQDEIRHELVESGTSGWEEWQLLDHSKKERLLGEITEEEIANYIVDTDKRAEENTITFSNWSKCSTEEKRKIAIGGLLEKHIMDTFYQTTDNAPWDENSPEQKLLDAIFKKSKEK